MDAIRRVARLSGRVGLLLLLGFVPAALATQEFTDVSAVELKAMLENEPEVFLLNPLPSLLFRQGNIPGSINIRWFDIADSSAMPEDRTIPIVTYCMGPR